MAIEALGPLVHIAQLLHGLHHGGPAVSVCGVCTECVCVYKCAWGEEGVRMQREKQFNTDKAVLQQHMRAFLTSNPELIGEEAEHDGEQHTTSPTVGVTLPQLCLDQNLTETGLLPARCTPPRAEYTVRLLKL